MAGTSAGARKAWQTRKHGGSSILRRAWKGHTKKGARGVLPRAWKAHIKYVNQQARSYGRHVASRSEGNVPNVRRAQARAIRSARHFVRQGL